MEYYPDAEKGAKNLWRNKVEFGAEGTSHTPPAKHYLGIYGWDPHFIAIIYARARKERWLEAAQTELMTQLQGQREDGFISGMQFVGRWLDPEVVLAFERSAKASNYLQPPVNALATTETYYASLEHDFWQAEVFLNEVYPKIKRLYNYIEVNRSNSDDGKLIGVIHPHETGRDSDPTFDFIKPWRLKRNGPETARHIDIANIAIDYLSILAHGVKLRHANGDIAKSREIFWVNDVMMNCIYADNLYKMAELATATFNVQDNLHFSELAKNVEQQILTKMWFPNARDGKGAFYALNKDGSPLKEISISNLFPLTLPNLREEQLESILDLMDSSFNTTYPLPSVATDSPNYDPHNHEWDRLWRGPTWINTNWYLAERGLKTQIGRSDLAHRKDLIDRCREWEQRIIQSSRKLIDKSGLYEHFDPDIGKGQRKRVKSFAWSNLGYVMLKSAPESFLYLIPYQRTNIKLTKLKRETNDKVYGSI